MTLAPKIPTDLRTLLAEALQAYEVAVVMRYSAQQQAITTREQAEASRTVEFQQQQHQMAVAHSTAQEVVRAEQRRAADLLAAINTVAQAARELLEATGLAHIIGAPISVVTPPLPAQRPDEVIASAFTSTQVAATDLRLALLRLAEVYIECEQWETARDILQPLLMNKTGHLYAKARDLLCETYYRPGQNALAAGAWTDARRELAAVLATNPQYRDAEALLRESYLRPARTAIAKQQWESARNRLSPGA